MDPHGGRAGPAAVNEGSSPAIPSEIDEEAMWQMSYREGDEPGPYPEHPGEPSCAYYIRTGLWRFGMTCKFNHPANRKLAVTEARIKGGYLERVGQPDFHYYMKTGTCQFGLTCKFHHPREAGIAGQVQLNILVYPLRLGEKEYAYYLRTGLCKFGSTCKFHHPQLTNVVISSRGSPVYPPVHSPTNPRQQSYAGRLANWSLSRASFIPSPRWQGPSRCAQLIVPQGLVQVSNWNPYSGELSSVSSPENQQQTPVTARFLRQTETATGSGTFSSYLSGSIPMGFYPMQRENVFPERPDQPECQFYMTTGDCKFGATCKFHNPRERLVPTPITPNCVLSPLGLPLRPEEPLCLFYSRYGICSFPDPRATGSLVHWVRPFFFFGYLQVWAQLQI